MPELSALVAFPFAVIVIQRLHAEVTAWDTMLHFIR